MYVGFPASMLCRAACRQRAAPRDGHGPSHPQSKALFYGLMFLSFIPTTIKSGQLLLTIHQLQMRS